MTADLSVPEPWSKWHAAVSALVAALSDTISYYGQPVKRINRAQWQVCVATIRVKQAECEAAATSVGNLPKRATISPTLTQAQAAAEGWVEWIVMKAADLKLDGSESLHRWHAEASTPLEQLRLRVSGRILQQEVATAVLTHHEPSGAHKPPRKKGERQILAALWQEAMTGEELAKATDQSPRTISRLVKTLIEDQLVKNDSEVGGYYRPDAPPV